MHKYLCLIFLLLTVVACSSVPPEIEVACDIDDEYNYHLKWETRPALTGNVRVYASTHPDQFDLTKQPDTVCPIADTYVTLPRHDDKTSRRYFRMIFDNKYARTTSARYVIIKDVENFRDIGGYESRTGHHVRWGRIFRSGELDSITPEGTARFNALGIRTLIDFRDIEDTSYPQNEIHLCNIIHLPGSLHYRNTLKSDLLDNKLKGEDAVAFMQNLNMALSVSGKNMLRAMFNQLLVEENYPILLSCINGKDYTGFAVALLLSALDIYRSEILFDYRLSNLKYDRRRYVLNIDKQPDATQEALTRILKADEKYILCALQQIEKEYGSIRNYLEKEIGLTGEKRKQLRQLLLD